MSDYNEPMHTGHTPESQQLGHEHVHGYNSFLDRWWKPIVIGLGCIGVTLLMYYNPTAN